MPKFAVGAPQADHLTMFTRLDSVAEGGKPSLVYGCLEQVPMSACSSSAKISGWAVTQKRCLNGSTIPMQGPTPDANLVAMGQNQLAALVCQCFINASLTVEKAVSCYKADRLVASLLSFRSVQSSLAVCEFQWKNAVNEAAGGCV